MKIAQITPLYEAVPPRLYGGTERVVAHLTDALVDLGHDVTLFASADAQTKARLVPVRDQAIRLDPAPLKSDLAAHMSMLGEVLDRAEDFDVIHFHTDMIHFPLFQKYADKTLTTLHGRLDMKDLPGVYARWSEFGLVSISDDQRKPLHFANWKATVHHGMPGEQYIFSPKSEGYLAFLGRISPEKRPDRAIEIATKLGKRLKMAAKVDAADKRYWEETIRPLVEGQSPDRVHRRNRRPSEVRLPWRRRRPAVPHRLARALRPGDDRGHCLRHAGRGLPLRLDARGDRGRRHRLPGRYDGTGHRRRRSRASAGSRGRARAV